MILVGKAHAVRDFHDLQIAAREQSLSLLDSESLHKLHRRDARGLAEGIGEIRRMQMDDTRQVLERERIGVVFGDVLQCGSTCDPSCGL